MRAESPRAETARVDGGRADEPHVKIATAPVNFGIHRANDPFIGPEEYTRLAADCGYQGTDLGPLGYLPPVLGSRMRLAGGRHDLPFGRRRGFDDGLAKLDTTTKILRELNQYPESSAFAPKPTLACPPSQPLSDSGWALLGRQVDQAATRCRAAGLVPVFHHHTNTSVETPDEIDRLLQLTDVDLCLDTGHLLAAGGDPPALLARWGARVRHVHVKDATADGVFCRLGDGTLDLSAFVDALRSLGYEGWLVVEQDAPKHHRDLGRIVADLRHNRAELAKLGL